MLGADSERLRADSQQTHSTRSSDSHLSFVTTISILFPFQ